MAEDKIFERLKEGLRPYRRLMAQASETIIRQDISSNPVFIAHQLHDVQIGIPLVEYKEGKTIWGVHASTLEELTAKGVIAPDKVEQFQSVFKNPERFFCIFLVDEKGGHFAFMPATDSML
jgi:hypothetical protein